MSIEQAALRLAGDVYGLLEIEEFRVGLLSSLRQEIPSDWASMNEIGLNSADIYSIVQPPLDARWHRAWEKYALQNPLVERTARTHDGRPCRFSDVIGVEELHALDLYRELYRPIGLEYQMAFTLPSDSGRILGVALSRRERDFSDAERDLLEVVRPHLIQAYNNAVQHTRISKEHGGHAAFTLAPRIELLRSRGLTAREAEVLCMASSGQSNRQIAMTLQISARTVEKHLQRCYAKLGVHARSQAAALVRETSVLPST